MALCDCKQEGGDHISVGARVDLLDTLELTKQLLMHIECYRHSILEKRCCCEV